MVRRTVGSAVFLSSLLVTGVSAGASLRPCQSTRYEFAGEPSTFYISVDQVLALAEGSFDVPTRWRSSCEATPDHFTRPAECQNPESIVHELDDSETVVHITVSHQGEPALIHHATEEQPVCAEQFRLPVAVRLTSDDGVLDEELDAEIGTECGSALGIGFSKPLRTLEGRVGQAGGEDAGFEFTFGFFRDRVWLDVYVTLAGSSGWILTNDLPPYDQRPHDIGFDEAGISPELALAEKVCAYMEILRPQGAE